MDEEPVEGLTPEWQKELAEAVDNLRAALRAEFGWIIEPIYRILDRAAAWLEHMGD